MTESNGVPVERPSLPTRGVSIGFFSVEHELGPRHAEICERIRGLCPPKFDHFPFSVSPLMNDKGEHVAAYATVRGHVPIHIDRPNANQRSQSLFTFVLEAEERPVMLTAPASNEHAQVIFTPELVKMPRMGFGALELVPGRAVHFDITRYFHGITSFPTGETCAVPTVPSATLIQVPHARADDIGGAIETMRRVLRLDSRLSDLVGPRG